MRYAAAAAALSPLMPLVAAALLPLLRHDAMIAAIAAHTPDDVDALRCLLAYLLPRR